LTNALYIYDPAGGFDGSTLGGTFETTHCADISAIADDAALLLWCGCQQVDEVVSLLSARDPNKLAVVVCADGFDAAAVETLFGAGVADVVTSEYQAMLGVRIQQAAKNLSQKSDLLLRATRANEMAFSAMANTADLGACLQFFMKSVECENFDSLGKLFFETMNHFHIDCVLQIRSDFGVVNLAPKGKPGDFEVLLLGHLKDRGRFFDHKQRTIVNYESISLLIKNMPVSDPVKYGQIKDNILTVVEAVDMKTRELDNIQALCNEKELMKRIVQRVQAMVKGVDDSFNKVIKDIASVVENMVQSTEEIIPQLMMSEEQESSIEAIMQRGISDTQRVFSDGLKVDEGFRDFLEELGRVTTQESISHAQMAYLLEKLRD
jgi:hypothetical protein